MYVQYVRTCITSTSTAYRYGTCTVLVQVLYNHRYSVLRQRGSHVMDILYIRVQYEYSRFCTVSKHLNCITRVRLPVLVLVLSVLSATVVLVLSTVLVRYSRRNVATRSFRKNMSVQYSEYCTGMEKLWYIPKVSYSTGYV